jgi:hypothetical protein
MNDDVVFCVVVVIFINESVVVLLLPLLVQVNTLVFVLFLLGFVESTTNMYRNGINNTR